MRLRLSAALAAALLLPTVAIAQADEKALFDARVKAWADKDHILDVAAFTPQEAVKPGVGGPLPLADPERRSISTQALADAIAYVKPLETQSLLVWQRGKLQLEWYGEGSGPQSTSMPASMMKPVLAMAVGVAIERGLIKSADEPIGTYLPEWRNDPRGAITIRQMLQMTSGLKKDSAVTAGGRGGELMLGTRLEKTYLETELVGAPGDTFDYNNVVPGILGLVLERATGKRYADWLSEAVWRPMGGGKASVWLDRPGGLARTYCCLITTARDWVRLGLLVKDGGRARGRQVVPAGWIEEMIAPSPKNPNFGYQVWRASPYLPERGYGTGTALKMPAKAPFLAEDMVYFDGAIGQRVYVSRARDLVIVRIGKSTMKWDDSALPNIVVAGLAH